MTIQNQTIMNRLEKIEQLEQIQLNIEATERLLASLPRMAYYSEFNRYAQLKHDICIKNKCLAYWKRRFNRELLKLGYKL